MAGSDSLTAARLRELLHYDPETGVFTRRIAVGYRGCHRAGEVAGTLKDGYIIIGIDGRLHRAHRLAWLYMHGCWPPREIDHVSGVRHDNRAANLRLATRPENAQNLRRPCSNNKTGFLGVSWSKQRKKYCAGIESNGKSYNLGRFSTAEAAYAAYLAAKRRLHPRGTL